MGIKDSKGIESFVGCVVDLVERHVSRGWDDHDTLTYAIVHTQGEGFSEVYVRCIGYGGDTATIDAPAEIVARYHSYVALEREFSRRLDILKDARKKRDADRKEASRVAKGRHAMVVKGRKVAIGTMGLVIWEGESTYGPRIGIKDAAGTVHWTAASNAVLVAAALPAACYAFDGKCKAA
jgi:hypothetical protein